MFCCVGNGEVAESHVPGEDAFELNEYLGYQDLSI